MFTSYAFSEVIFCGSEQRKNMRCSRGVGPEFGAYLEIGVLALRNEEARALVGLQPRRRRWSSSRSDAIPLIEARAVEQR